MAGIIDRVLVEVDGEISGLQKQLAAAGKSVGDFSGKVDGALGGLGGLGGPMGAVADRLSGVSGMLTSTAGAAGLLGVAVAGLGVESLRRAADVELGMRRVSNAVGQPVAVLGDLRTAARDLAVQFGVVQTDVLGTMEGIAKGGAGSAAGVRAMTEATLALAAATNEDRGGVAAGLDQVMDAFGVLPTRAREVAATLFTLTQGRNDLAGVFDVLGKLAPAAQAAGLGLEDVAGATVALLEQGYTAKQAAAQVKEWAEAGADGKRKIRELAGELPPMTTQLAQLGTAATNGTDPVKQLSAAFDAMLTSLAGSGGGKGLLAVLEAIAETMGDHLPGATRAATSALNAYLATYWEYAAKVQRGAPETWTDGTITNAGSAQLAARKLARRVSDEDPRFLQLLTEDQLRGALATLDNAARSARAVLKTGADAAIREYGDAAAALEGRLEIVRARAAAANTPLGTATGAPHVETPEERAKRQREAAERLGRQAAALDAFHSATAALTPGKADDFEQQIAKLVEGARKAGVASDLIRAAVAELRAAGAAKLQADQEAFGAQLHEQLLRLTGDAVDLATAELARFDRDLAEKRRAAPGGAFAATVQAEVDAMRAALVQVRDAAQAAKAQGETLAGLARLTDGGAGRLAEMRALLPLLDQERAIADDTTQSVLARTAARERAAGIEARIVALQQQQAQANDASAKAQQATESRSLRLVTSLKTAANAAAGLATAFAGATAEITRMLSGVASVAGGVEELMTAATGAGGLGKLLSTGGGIATAAGAVGGIVAGAGALVSLLGGPPDPAEVAARQAIEANTRALYELTSTLGATDLVGTGQQEDTILTAVSRAMARYQTDVGKGTIASYASQQAMQNLRSDLEGQGISWAQFQAFAKARGIDVSGDWAKMNKGGATTEIEAVRQLFASFGALGVQFQQMEEAFAVHGADGQARLQGYLELLAQVPETATNKTAQLARELKTSYDLTTAAGREAAIALVRARYDAEVITGDVATEIIARIEAAGHAAASAPDQRTASEVAAGAARLTEATGATLADLLRTQVAVGREQLDAQRGTRTAVEALVATLAAATPVAPPRLPVSFYPSAPANAAGGATAAGGGGTQVHVAVTVAGVTIGGGVMGAPGGSAAGSPMGSPGSLSAADVGALLGDALGARLLDTLNEAFGAQWQQDRLLAGDLTVRGG